MLAIAIYRYFRNILACLPLPGLSTINNYLDEKMQNTNKK